MRTTPSATSTATTRRSPSASTNSSSGSGPNAAVPIITRATPADDERLRVRDRAHAAAELHRHGRGGFDRAARELERRAAVARGAERDDVDERGTGGRDARDQLERVAAVHGHAVVGALLQADGLPVQDVHGGEQLEIL